MMSKSLTRNASEGESPVELHRVARSEASKGMGTSPALREELRCATRQSSKGWWSLRPRWRFGLVFALIAGCSSSNDEPSMPIASAAKRAERRLFPGVLPVIPHAPLSGKCVTCHTPTGSARPPLGLAPANPHTKTPGMSDESRCKQCHVFQTTQDVFVASTFEPLHIDSVHGPKAHSLAPPTIPHHRFMREDCSACHTGPASRPEIRCAHSDRARCVQCHVFQTPGDSPFEHESAEHTARGNRTTLDSTVVHETSTR